jgi:hypothetical protein
MSEAESATRSTRGSGVVAALLVAVLLPLFYVLSVGPVGWAADSAERAGLISNNGWIDKGLTLLYFPLGWLHNNTPLKEPLDSYIKLWGG